MSDAANAPLRYAWLTKRPWGGDQVEAPALPSDEAERLEVLRSLELLDTPPEPDFDGFVALASGLADTPIALVSLVDGARQWFKARRGLDAAETPRDVSFCGHAILGAEPFIVPDAHADARFADNPLVTDAPHIRFYAGFPLEVDGQRMGTLCVIDHEPRELDARSTGLLRDLAEQISHCLQWRRRLLEREQAQADAHRQKPPAGLARMVVHDLAAPLTTILVNAGLIATDVDANDASREAAADIQSAGSLLQRMVLNLLDVSLSASRHLTAERRRVPMAALLEQTRAAVRGVLGTRGQTMNVQVADDIDSVIVDVDLVVRVLQNLIDNSSKYAPAKGTIDVRVGREGDLLRITVDDEGPGIPDNARERIFDAGVRLDRDALHHQRTSHGLGLAFCKLAVQAHQGDIWAERNAAGGNRFCVTLPLS
jgi:K+-sensing histidine kinase KdpD